MTTTSTIPSALTGVISRIPAPKPETEARARLDNLTKPLGSLGRLEDLAAQLNSLSITELRKAAYVFAASHGLTAEGVSPYPSAVTRQMILNVLAGGAAINILARLHYAAVHIIDCGVDCGVAGPLPNHPSLTRAPIRQGSRNTLHEPAMTPEEFNAALELGLACAGNSSIYNLIAVGEMGIGNTSAASLLTAALTHRPLSDVTGTGTGHPDIPRKTAILTQVLAFHKPHLDTPAEILRRLGGLEIAAMTAFILGAAANRTALLIDGFISTAAAAFALAFAPQVRPWLFAAHRSQEPGHRILLTHLDLHPILNLHMRLGEGTGAVLAMPILESALALYQQMATFTSANVSTAGTAP